MKERWLPVRNHEGLYEVSELGRIRSMIMPTSAGTVLRKTPLLLKWNSKGRGGYPAVTLYKGGVPSKHFVHALVAEAFIGPRPEGFEVRHRDGGVTVPALFNIHYGTKAQNQQDRIKHGTDVRAEKHPKCKLSDAVALEVRRRALAGESGRALANEFGVSAALVSKLKLGQVRSWLEV